MDFYMTHDKGKIPSKIAVITGPTATGKTRLGVLLAQSLNGEIVSADSMQVYRGMDIGSAKPTASEMGGIAHHMLDVADITESYSAARYVREARICVDDILSRGKLPIVVGGTGLYIDSLISGREFSNPPGDKNLRLELELQYDSLGGDALLKKLAKADPQRAEKLHPSDKRRIIRALEVYALTGKTITEHDIQSKLIPPLYNACRIALTYENRGDLYKRINKRVDHMISSGLVSEVSALMSSGLSENTTAIQGIGYKEVVSALQNRLTIEEAIEKIKLESRRYAKRQLTWLRRRGDINWILWKENPDFDWGRQHSTCFLQDSE